MDKQESSQTLVLDSWLLSDSWLSRPVSPVSHPPLEVDGGRTTRASRSAGRKAPTCPTLWRLTTATSAFERMMSSWRAEDRIPIVFCHLNGEKDHEPAWWFGIYHPRHHYLYLFYIYYIYIDIILYIIYKWQLWPVRRWLLLVDLPLLSGSLHELHSIDPIVNNNISMMFHQQ
jgi:hypothetical protein